MGMRAEESAARASKLPWKRSRPQLPRGEILVRLAPDLRPHGNPGLRCHPRRPPIAASGLRDGNVETVMRVLHRGLARRSAHRRAIPAGPLSPVRPP